MNPNNPAPRGPGRNNPGFFAVLCVTCTRKGTCPVLARSQRRVLQWTVQPSSIKQHTVEARKPVSETMFQRISPHGLPFLVGVRYSVLGLRPEHRIPNAEYRIPSSVTVRAVRRPKIEEIPRLARKLAPFPSPRLPR